MMRRIALLLVLSVLGLLGAAPSALSQNRPASHQVRGTIIIAGHAVRSHVRIAHLTDGVVVESDHEAPQTDDVGPWT